jgi:hypothetical protein
MFEIWIAGGLFVVGFVLNEAYTDVRILKATLPAKIILLILIVLGCFAGSWALAGVEISKRLKDKL